MTNISTSTSKPGDWQDELLRELLTDKLKKEWLFIILELVRSQHESSSPIPAINELVSCYLRHTKNESLNRGHIRSAMNLVTFLSELRSAFDCFDMDSTYSNAATTAKEEGGPIHE